VGGAEFILAYTLFDVFFFIFIIIIPNHIYIIYMVIYIYIYFFFFFLRCWNYSAIGNVGNLRYSIIHYKFPGRVCSFSQKSIWGTRLLLCVNCHRCGRCSFGSRTRPVDHERATGVLFCSLLGEVWTEAVPKMFHFVVFGIALLSNANLCGVL